MRSYTVVVKTLSQQLAQYADYHRDQRNVATHLVGIPLIVIAVAVLLSRPGISIAGMSISPATLLVAAVLLFYFALDVRLALVMTLLLALVLWLAGWIAAQSTALWLAVGAGAFVTGWAFQLVGHHYEGRKPAFLDDVVGLLIGPLFVVVELLLAIGIREDLRDSVLTRSR